MVPPPTRVHHTLLPPSRMCAAAAAAGPLPPPLLPQPPLRQPSQPSHAQLCPSDRSLHAFALDVRAHTHAPRHMLLARNATSALPQLCLCAPPPHSSALRMHAQQACAAPAPQLNEVTYVGSTSKLLRRARYELGRQLALMLRGRRLLQAHMRSTGANVSVMVTQCSPTQPAGATYAAARDSKHSCRRTTRECGVTTRTSTG
jgi:hypothetical protein